jgi:hypothetical protein
LVLTLSTQSARMRQMSSQHFSNTIETICENDAQVSRTGLLHSPGPFGDAYRCVKDLEYGQTD